MLLSVSREFSKLVQIAHNIFVFHFHFRFSFLFSTFSCLATYHTQFAFNYSYYLSTKYKQTFAHSITLTRRILHTYLYHFLIDTFRTFCIIVLLFSNIFFFFFLVFVFIFVFSAFWRLGESVSVFFFCLIQCF